MDYKKVVELLDILIENNKKDLELDQRVREELLSLYKNK
jgi:hypothetical protein